MLQLSQQVQKLQDELDERPTIDAMELLHKEWQTSEELFDQSQRSAAFGITADKQRQRSETDHDRVASQLCEGRGGTLLI